MIKFSTYNLNGYELNLDSQILKKYSELTGEELNSEALNWTLIRFGKIMSNSESFEEAVNKIGLQTITNLIEKAIKEEIIELFGEEI